MYKFEDTIKRERISDITLPISAMNYDGIWLEEAIEGYRTLTVSGREIIAPEIQSESVHVGSIISSQRLPSRTLKITYQIKNDDPETILVNYRWLMEYLYREQDVPIYFNDELDVLYHGRFSGSDEVPGDRYTITASFDIYCADPRKYSTKTFFADEAIVIRFPYTTKPVKISVKVKKNGGIVVTDGDKNIKISESLKSGDLVVFDFLAGQVFINGLNKTSLLDLTSDFENFYLKQGQKITCSNGSLTIEYKEVTY